MAKTAKVSMTLDGDALAWARDRAQERQMSLSSVVSEALERMRQHEARLGLLEQLGTADITDEDLQALYAEWREAGLKV